MNKRQQGNGTVGCVVIPALFILALAFLAWAKLSTPAAQPEPTSETVQVEWYGDSGAPRFDLTIGYGSGVSKRIADRVYKRTEEVERGSTVFLRVESYGYQAVCSLEVDGVEVSRYADMDAVYCAWNIEEE